MKFNSCIYLYNTNLCEAIEPSCPKSLGIICICSRKIICILNLGSQYGLLKIKSEYMCVYVGTYTYMRVYRSGYRTGGMQMQEKF